MSDLQIGLLALAGGLILVVIFYNQWQARRHRRAAEALFRGAQPDVLTAGDTGGTSAVPPADGLESSAPSAKLSPIDTAQVEERREPVLGADHATELETVPASVAMTDESRGMAVGAGAADARASAPAEEAASGEAAGFATSAIELPLPEGWADPVVDVLVRLDLPAPVSLAVLHARQAGWSGRLKRPLRALALTGQGWQALAADHDGPVRAVVFAAQLCDRRGAIGEDEIDIFLAGMQALVDEFAARAAVPSKASVLEHAQSLDQFCAGVDLQLGFGLVAGSGVSFPGTKLRGLAEAAGLSLQEDGRFHYRDDNGRLLFTVGNAIAEPLTAENLRSQSLAGLMLTLDVPRVADGPQVFDRMLMVARQLAQGLGGKLVDSQGRPLGDAMIQGIRSKIAEVQKRMAAHQIPPGGERALRLFA